LALCKFYHQVSYILSCNFFSTTEVKYKFKYISGALNYKDCENNSTNMNNIL
jgi:hypothetical protein